MQSMVHSYLISFTAFVIALSFFFLILKSTSDSATFPEVGPGVLALLGISGGSYLISKGIQATKENAPTTSGQEDDQAPPP